jgi:hypothetical protein
VSITVAVYSRHLVGRRTAWLEGRRRSTGATCATGARRQREDGETQERSSLTANLYGNASAGDAIALFDQFVLSETESGEAILMPKDVHETAFEDAPMVAKEVPDLGLFNISKLTPAKARGLPKWSGTQVRGGELFVEDTDSPRMRFVLVNGSSVTTIMPKLPLARDSQAVSELAELQVGWAS